MYELPNFLLGHKKYLALATLVILFTEVIGFSYLVDHYNKPRSQKSLVLSTNSSHSAVLNIATRTAIPSSTPSSTPSATPSVKPSVVVAPKAVSAPPKNTGPVANTRLGWPNNKYGIYSYRDAASIESSAELVNSSGGDWGWILFPMNIKEGDKVGWDHAFGVLKEKHLIPIIQLILDPGYAPNETDVSKIADFLNSLNWPTKKRFVSAFNEVNAAEYWGNKLDPEGHAQILNKYIDTMRSRSGDFFILNGAFNASARTGKVRTNLGVDTEYLDEPDFLVRMNNAVPGIFKKLDGWAVHTYPQPEYLGKPLDTTIPGEAAWEKGRNTMSSYKWELNILKTKFGVDLPIFITEMGWPHKEGSIPHPEWVDQTKAAEYYKTVFQDLLNPDGRVVAAVPFGIKIDQLDNFSFVAKDGSHFPQFDAIKSLPKVKGEPPLN